MLPSSSWITCLGVVAATISSAWALVLDHSSQTIASLANETVTLNGHSELHLTGGGDPMTGCTVHLNSEDAWVFLHEVKPSFVQSNLLSRFRVDGVVANLSLVRIVQHANGAVVIPQGSDFEPLEVFDGRNFTGSSRHLAPYVGYDDGSLGIFANSIRSFILKRGWMATVAEDEDGSGESRVYIAQDSDLEIPALSGLDNKISFVRIFPWRWVGKKGSCDVSPDSLKANWHYNWSISKNSPLDWEYVAIKQQPFWPGTNQNWETRQVNHLSGFNEPDNPVEDAYQNLSPNGSTSDAVARYTELVGTGLRVGAPAVTDAGLGWLFDFMNKADTAGIRIDYVPVHYYRSQWDNNPSAAASALYNFLKSINDTTGLPVWVTEFNNGANWTDNAHDPSTGENRAVIEAMINMMDDISWIERYSVYSRVEWFRQTHYDDGSLTPMGTMYRDHQAPIGHQQVVPNHSSSGSSEFLFEDNTRDTSGNGNVALTYGTPGFVAGKRGRAIELDGDHDYLRISPRIGDGGDFTFAAWVKWDGGGNWQRIFDFGNGGTQRYFYLTPSAGGNLRFTITTSGWGGEQRLNTTPLTPGRWTHVAVTISGNTGKLFVDGTPVASSNSMTVNPSDIGTEFNYLGKSQFAADPLFDGALDDVRFHNYALSDAEVQNLAAPTSPQFSTATLDSFPVGLSVQDSLTSMVSGGSGALRFEKLGGPSWLSLAADGALLGVPRLSDVGEEVLLVRVADTNGISDIAELLVEVTSPDPTARYPFDNSPQNVLGGDPASLVGGPVYASGYRGQALQFDGSNDHVVLPEGVASSEKLTFAAWVKWDGGDIWQRIFDFGNDTDSYLFLSPKSPSNRLRFAIKDGGSEQALETTVLPVGVWSHVAVTLGDGVGRLYVDGALRATNSSMTLSPADIKPRINYLGRSQWPDPYFDGVIDEVGIFPRVLTLSEMNALRLSHAPSFDQSVYLFSELAPGDVFETSLADNLSGGSPPFVFSKLSGPVWLTVDANGRLSGIPEGAETGTNHFTVQVIDANNLATSALVTIPVSLVPGLMAHYEFEDNSRDRVSNLHGTRYGSPVFGDGSLGRSLIFDGSNDYVRFPTDYVSDLNDATFVIRYRWHGGGAWQRVLDFGNNTSEYLFLTPSNGSGLTEFRITTGGSATAQSLTAPASPIDEWVHAVITLSGNTGSLYLNGTLVDTGTMTLNPRDIAPTLNYLGKSQWPDPLFDGEIDDFQIHSRALSANEVRLLARGSETATVEPGYDFWAEGYAFESSTESGWNEDPDKDGSLNVFEWLFDTHPLNGNENPAYTGQVVTAASLGLAGNDSYLALTARVRKSRPQFNLVAQGATDLDSFDHPGSEDLAISLTPIDDGEFEWRTWFFASPVNGNPQAFLRLKVTPQ